jgi:transcriptional regulator with GAF, ATPase, and Fis domain
VPTSLKIIFTIIYELTWCYNDEIKQQDLRNVTIGGKFVVFHNCEIEGVALMIDKNEFFRQATLRICGHLDIEVALHSCAKYLESFMPVNKIYMEFIQWDMNSMCIIAQASPQKGKKMNIMAPLPPEAKTEMSTFLQNYAKEEFPNVVIRNQSELDPISHSMLSFLGEPASSLLVMFLSQGEEYLGAVVVLAEGDNRYKEEDARLLSLLKEPFVVAMSNTLRHREVLRLKDMLIDDNRYLQRELLQFSGDDIIGADFGLKHIMEMVRKVAPLDSPVLLLGETGVGKDVLANTIHYSSHRSDGPMITVNCGAIPDTLIDSELFGHEKGSFTGASSQKRGRFERADSGTIFLDEIGELPPQVQVRLLRVLQNKEFERVGGSQSIKVDVRVISATNKNLEEMVKSDAFREDLWFRLNVFPVMIPPLRARKEDIPAFAYHFLESRSKQMKISPVPTLAPGAMDRLMDYNWPGNVRELENIIERALILNPEGPLKFDNLEVPRGRDADSGEFKGQIQSFGDSLELDTMISRHIKRVIAMSKGKIHGPGGAAEILKVNPSTLRSKMKKMGIDYGRKSKS